MNKRLRTVGMVLAVIGLIFMAAGVVAYTKVQDGYGSLQAFSEAQSVTLSYNEPGELTDQGTTEGAQAILALLEEDWGYRVVQSDLDSDNPLVDTAAEYMYQMATIGYHVLHGTQTIVLPEDVEYDGQVFAAGTYKFEVDGRYWTDFDRSHPIEGSAREQAWSGTVHGLFGELAVGTVSHSALQLGFTIAALLAGVGLMTLTAGSGLIWASRAKRDVVIPDRVPEAFLTETTLPERFEKEAPREPTIS